MSSPVPALVTDGDPRNGVVRFARELAAGVNAEAGPVRATDALHLQFADRVWGSSPADAARRVTELAAGRRLTLTLHDVPQVSDGPGLARRVGGYRAAVAASAGIVCNSHHEARLLRETGVLGDGDPEPGVIPLPVMIPPILPPPSRPRHELALLGFVYPGKGHAEAIAAASRLRPRPAVRALGAPAPGHARDLAGLRAHARRHGVAFTVTGWLSESALLAACRAAAVPLAAHTHVSASGSIGSWIAAGRRPLVRDSRYAREVEGLRPGTIRRYPAGQLRAAVGGALSDPPSTWQAPDTSTRPHLADVARAYLDWWAAR
jgi:hypothetical protein